MKLRARMHPMSTNQSNNADWIARDLAVLWHPCTQMRDHPHPIPLLPIVSAQGCWLQDADGKRYLDAISSWWVTLFGHSNPAISAAIAEQAARLDHVLMAGFGHPPAVQLAERLLAMVGEPMRRVFFAEAGSAAIEIALKLSFHYWRNVGQPKRKRFLVLDQGYHGETIGALSLTSVSLYRDTYGELLLEPLFALSPDSRLAEPGESAADYALRCADQLEALLADNDGEVCAVVLEPLVQCAGGMAMYPASYLRAVRAVCDRQQVHLIADEIAVGLGRTGTLLACDQAQIRPDILCIGKGLSGGTLPLAAVLAPESIYQSFLGEYGSGKAFLHSHSYTGFAIGCAAALATMDLLEAAQQGLPQRGERLGQALSELADHAHTRHYRRSGLIAAVDMVCANGQPFPAEQRRGLAVYRHALQSGVVLRPLGDTVYAFPPLSISDDEIDTLAQVALESVHAATR